MKIVIDVAAHEPALAELRKRTDCKIECIVPPEEKARELNPEHIRDADVLFCTFPPTNHAAMQNLKWIQIASVGYTQLFGLDLPIRGVRATNARGCFDVPIAEWNIAMMVNLVRDFSRCFATRTRRFEIVPQPFNANFAARPWDSGDTAASDAKPPGSQSKWDCACMS